MASMFRGMVASAGNMGNQLKGMATEAATHYHGQYIGTPQQYMSQQNNGYQPLNNGNQLSDGNYQPQYNNYPSSNTTMSMQTLAAIAITIASLSCLSSYANKINMNPNTMQFLFIVCWLITAILIGLLIYGFTPMMGGPVTGAIGCYIFVSLIISGSVTYWT